jgi:hypothetical protein
MHFAKTEEQETQQCNFASHFEWIQNVVSYFEKRTLITSA